MDIQIIEALFGIFVVPKPRRNAHERSRLKGIFFPVYFSSTAALRIDYQLPGFVAVHRQERKTAGEAPIVYADISFPPIFL